MNTSKEFYYENAGWSYDQRKQTPEEGRQQCAVSLSVAAMALVATGYQADWNIDPDIDSSDFSDDPDPWTLWECYLKDWRGDVVGAIGGIDLGRHGTPMDDPYADVVAAEMMLEHLKNKSG